MGGGGGLRADPSAAAASQHSPEAAALDVALSAPLASDALDDMPGGTHDFDITAWAVGGVMVCLALFACRLLWRSCHGRLWSAADRDQHAAAMLLSGSSRRRHKRSKYGTSVSSGKLGGSRPGKVPRQSRRHQRAGSLNSSELSSAVDGGTLVRPASSMLSDSGRSLGDHTALVNLVTDASPRTRRTLTEHARARQHGSLSSAKAKPKKSKRKRHGRRAAEGGAVRDDRSRHISIGGRRKRPAPTDLAHSWSTWDAGVDHARLSAALARAAESIDGSARRTGGGARIQEPVRDENAEFGARGARRRDSDVECPKRVWCLGDEGPHRRAATAVISEAYELQDVVSVGTTATVRRCRERRTGHECCVKVLDKRLPLWTDVTRGGGGNWQRLVSELQISTSVHHEAICGFSDVYEDDECVYAVMPYMRGGTLLDYLLDIGRPMSEEEARVVMKRLFAAVEYLHDAAGVVHRDIKLENLLLARSGELESATLVDFGSARYLGPGERASSFLGSLQYLAPEVVACRLNHEEDDDAGELEGHVLAVPVPRRRRRHYGREADLWSCGVLLYALLCRRMPFASDADAPAVGTVEDITAASDTPVRSAAASLRTTTAHAAGGAGAGRDTPGVEGATEAASGSAATDGSAGGIAEALIDDATQLRIQWGQIAAPPDGVAFSRSVRSLFLKLLCVEASERLTAAEACSHPWVTGHGE